MIVEIGKTDELWRIINCDKCDKKLAHFRGDWESPIEQLCDECFNKLK